VKPRGILKPVNVPGYLAQNTFPRPHLANMTYKRRRKRKRKRPRLNAESLVRGRLSKMKRRRLKRRGAAKRRRLAKS